MDQLAPAQRQGWLRQHRIAAIFGLSLLTPLVLVLWRSVTGSAGDVQRLVGPAIALVALVPFFIAITLLVPGRYASNPTFGRIDLGLGPVSLAALILTSAPTLLVAIAFQDPAHRAIEVVAAPVCAAGAAGVTALSRRLWPEAWRSRQLARVAPAASAAPVGVSDVVIHPKRYAIALVMVIVGGLGAALIWTAVAGGVPDPAAGALVVLAGIGFIVLGLLTARLEAGCDSSQVWFRFAIGRRSAPRSAVASYAWITSFNGRGSLLLFDTQGARLLSIQSGLFADADVARFVQALNVPKVT